MSQITIEGELKEVLPGKISLKYCDRTTRERLERLCGDGVLPYNAWGFRVKVPKRIGTLGMDEMIGLPLRVTVTLKRFRFRATRGPNAGETITGCTLRFVDCEVADGPG